MAQHGHEDARHDVHAHDEERMNREILSDREWMFDAFVRIAGWHVVGILLVLALLALTNT